MRLTSCQGSVAILKKDDNLSKRVKETNTKVKKN